MTIWDERYKSGEGLRWWPNEELVRFLGKTYGDMRGLPGVGQHALELGCGTGCNLIALAAHGFFAHGVDASDDAALLAQEYVGEHVDGEAQFGVSQLTLPDTFHWPSGFMDLVVDCQTLQHLSEEDHIKTYAEIVRVLKPGGRFWSMHFFEGNPETAYADSYPELENRESHEMQILLKGAGLHVESMEQVERSYFQRTSFMAWWVIEARKL